MIKATADTKFILALFDAAHEKGDVFTSMNRYEIGDKIPMQARAVNAICKLLVQANFIKKEDEDWIYLTENGVALVKRLRKIN